jgi:hypothetical protein
MTQDTPNPASAAARTGAGDECFLGSEPSSDSRSRQNKRAQDPRAAREAKRLLQLEFLHECAGGIQVHAALVQTFAEIGDTAGACYSLRRLFAHVKAVHPTYLELREEAGQ